jgi:ribulose-bisphosphate carboxylase large chain
MRRRHDLVLAEGGTCVMASANSVGLTGLTRAAAACRPADPPPSQRLGLRSRGTRRSASTIRMVRALAAGGGGPHACQRHPQQVLRKRRQRDRLGARAADADDGGTPADVMPVFSSGQSAFQVHDTWSALRSPDLIFAAGGGIMAHRDGTGRRCGKLRDAWDAAMAGSRSTQQRGKVQRSPPPWRPSVRRGSRSPRGATVPAPQGRGRAPRPRPTGADRAAPSRGMRPRLGRRAQAR